MGNLHTLSQPHYLKISTAPRVEIGGDAGPSTPRQISLDSLETA